jgi:hypothetical protein
MDAWERLEALEDGAWHIKEAMEALKYIDRDAVAELADIRGRLAVETERQRARVRELEEQEEDALRREYEEDLL